MQAKLVRGEVVLSEVLGRDEALGRLRDLQP